jgi:hypothetical protein
MQLHTKEIPEKVLNKMEGHVASKAALLGVLVHSIL